MPPRFIRTQTQQRSSSISIDPINLIPTGKLGENSAIKLSICDTEHGLYRRMAIEVLESENRHFPKPVEEGKILELIEKTGKLDMGRRGFGFRFHARCGCDGLEESFLGEVSPKNRVIIEDGVAKLPDRSRFTGSVAAGDTTVKQLCGRYGLPLAVVSRMMSEVPARIPGLSPRGILAQG